jgi:hypothetical protein
VGWAAIVRESVLDATAMFSVFEFDMTFANAVITADEDPMVAGVPEMRPVTESI